MLVCILVCHYKEETQCTRKIPSLLMLWHDDYIRLYWNTSALISGIPIINA